MPTPRFVSWIMLGAYDTVSRRYRLALAIADLSSSIIGIGGFFRNALAMKAAAFCNIAIALPIMPQAMTFGMHR